MSSTFANSDVASTVRFCNGARALARCFSVPGDDLDEVSTLCRQAAGTETDELAENMRNLADLVGASERDVFAKSYARLFLGPFEVLVPPYASWFLDSEQRMMGPVAQAAAETYAASGLGPADGPRELPDHAAVELEFCYLLGYQGIEQGDEDAFARLGAFWCGQALPWLPKLAAAVKEHSDQPAFDALAETLRALVALGPTEAASLAMKGLPDGT